MAESQPEVWAAVRANVPPGETILSLATYDTFYYTGRDATWPIPWGQRNPPIEMFDDRDPEAILAHLKAHGIRWMLLPAEASRGAFNSGNFPYPFLMGVQRLNESGRVDLVWGRRDVALVRVKG
jgi:hypothetical protein